jgi:hypothetical protein
MSESARHAEERAECRWKRAGSVRPSNAWLQGPHWRACVNAPECPRRLWSTSKDQRVCVACRTQP